MLAAAVPVILHLTGRSKPIVHRFPAMRFILRSQRSSSRAMRLKHILVLLLRILAVILFCLAMARPYLSGSAIAASSTFFGVLLAAAGVFAFIRREYIAGLIAVLAVIALYASMPNVTPQLKGSLHADVVLVLDQSLSMNYQEASDTRFAIAQKQALELIDRLAPDSRVALLFAQRSVERAQGRLSYRQDEAREKIRRATAGAGGLDLSRALAAGAEIIDRDRASHNTGYPANVIFFTDLQQNSFAGLTAGKKSAHSGSDFNLVLVDLGSDARNGGALEVNLPGAVLPAESTATMVGKFRPLDKAHPSLIELIVDDKKQAQRLVDSQGRDEVDVSIPFSTGAAGPHAVTLRVADHDRLPQDQECYAVYVAGKPDRGLILEKPAAGQAKGSAFFLSAALLPAQQAAAGDASIGMSGLTCVVEPPGELTAAKLAEFKVIILADCGGLSDGSWSALQKWTEDGGGLFVWLGPNTDPAAVRRYGMQEFANHRGLLPGSIGELNALQKPSEISMTIPEHPLLAHQTNDVSRLLRKTLINRYLKVTPDGNDPNSAVVLSVGEDPLVLEKSYGRGRVILSTIDPGLEYSDLPKHAEPFVTFVLDAVRLLSQQESSVHARIGQPLELTLPVPPGDGHVLWRQPGVKDATLLYSDNLTGDAPLPGRGSSPANVSVPRLDIPGIHRFSWTPARATSSLWKYVAVNHDPSEVDLTRTPAAEVSKLLADWHPEIVKHFSESDLFRSLEHDSANAQKHDFASGLLIVLLALLLGESFLSNRFYRRDDSEEEKAEAPAGERRSYVRREN
jgi:hypothetical protein